MTSNIHEEFVVNDPILGSISCGDDLQHAVQFAEAIGIPMEVSINYWNCGHIIATNALQWELERNLRTLYWIH